MDKALQQQVGMVDPRKRILDMAMSDEIENLHEKIRVLQNRKHKEENERMQKVLAKKKASIIRSL